MSRTHTEDTVETLGNGHENTDVFIFFKMELKDITFMNINMLINLILKVIPDIGLCLILPTR